MTTIGNINKEEGGMENSHFIIASHFREEGRKKQGRREGEKEGRREGGKEERREGCLLYTSPSPRD